MYDSEAPSIPAQPAPAGGVTYVGIGAVLVFGIVIGAALVSDQQPKERPVSEARIVSAENSIKDLRADFEKYRNEQQSLAATDLDKFNIRLDSSTKAYGFLETNLGGLMVSVQDVQPYA